MDKLILSGAPVHDETPKHNASTVSDRTSLDTRPVRQDAGQEGFGGSSALERLALLCDEESH